MKTILGKELEPNMQILGAFSDAGFMRFERPFIIGEILAGNRIGGYWYSANWEECRYASFVIKPGIKILVSKLRNKVQ